MPEKFENVLDLLEAGWAVCSARGPYQERCDLDVGHEGWHQASMPDGVKTMWGQEWRKGEGFRVSEVP